MFKARRDKASQVQEECLQQSGLDHMLLLAHGLGKQTAPLLYTQCGLSAVYSQQSLLGVDWRTEYLNNLHLQQMIGAGDQRRHISSLREQ